MLTEIHIALPMFNTYFQPSPVNSTPGTPREASEVGEEGGNCQKRAGRSKTQETWEKAIWCPEAWSEREGWDGPAGRSYLEPARMCCIHWGRGAPIKRIRGGGG